MNVILIGYRGCGKTSAGRGLASRRGMTFVDVDDVTCDRFGNDSIADIWATHGEPAWRTQEVEVTRELVAKPNHVIGLGGGTLMQPGARAAVEQAADTLRVYLCCDPEELHRRIHADDRSAATRPALTAHGGGLKEIRAVLADREPVYRAVADVQLDVTQMDIDDIVEWLNQQLENAKVTGNNG